MFFVKDTLASQAITTWRSQVNSWYIVGRQEASKQERDFQGRKGIGWPHVWITGRQDQVAFHFCNKEQHTIEDCVRKDDFVSSLLRMGFNVQG